MICVFLGILESNTYCVVFLFCFPVILCTLCCQFLWIVFVLFSCHLVYPMLSVSLDCFRFAFRSSCVPYVASFSGSFSFCFPVILCTLCCQFLWIVFVLFVFVSSTLCCQFLWIVLFYCPFGILERLFVYCLMLFCFSKNNIPVSMLMLIYFPRMVVLAENYNLYVSFSVTQVSLHVLGSQCR